MERQKQSYWYCLLFCLLASGGLYAQVEARLNLLGTEVEIGDDLGAQLNISVAPGVEITQINYAAWADSALVEIAELKPLQTVAQNSEQLLQQQLRLQFFDTDTGYVSLPPLRILYEQNGQAGIAYAPAVRLTVSYPRVGEDLLHKNEHLAEPLNWRDFAPWVLALLIVLALLYAAWWMANRQAKARPQPAAPPPPPTPAHELALAELDRLATDRAWERGEIKAFQTDLTYILRAYLENRFDMNALEATTPEIDAQLKEKNIIQRNELLDLLQTADMVKFAKAIPDLVVHTEGLAKVRAFVLATKQLPEPEVTAPENPAADE